jgi:DNA-directed RNA polymerase subunit K
MGYTKYERAKMIGARALQIGMGAPFLIELSKEDLERIHYNPIEVAKMEYEKGIIPITIRQPMPKPAEDTEERATESFEKPVSADTEETKEKESGV